MPALWLNPFPLVLASKSSARRAILGSAGIPFDTVAADVDERAIEAPLLEKGAGAGDIALHLAEAKAAKVGVLKPGHLVLGADQCLSFEGGLVTKAQNRAEAEARLKAFSGRTHELHSALCIMRDGTKLFETVETAHLHCRIFSDAFIEAYAEAAGEALTESVGAYKVEGLGIHLFEAIEGDHTTILGLPLLPLLQFLRAEGSLLS